MSTPDCSVLREWIISSVKFTLIIYGEFGSNNFLSCLTSHPTYSQLFMAVKYFTIKAHIMIQMISRINKFSQNIRELIKLHFFYFWYCPWQFYNWAVWQVQDLAQQRWGWDPIIKRCWYLARYHECLHYNPWSGSSIQINITKAKQNFSVNST